MADAVARAPTYVGQIERGSRNPTLKIVEEFARVLGVEPLALLRPPPSSARD